MKLESESTSHFWENPRLHCTHRSAAEAITNAYTPQGALKSNHPLFLSNVLDPITLLGLASINTQFSFC